MRTDNWAGVELAKGTLRLWLMKGKVEIAMREAAAGGDPVAALQALLRPLLAPGQAISVIAAGWPDVIPVPVPCRPPVPLGGRAIDPQIALHPLPGLSQDRPADLIANPLAIAGHLFRHPDCDGVVCIPGDPTVWAHLSAGEIVSFRSFLTAELLAAVAPTDAGPVEPGQDGFGDAVHHAMSRPAGFAADLSSVRALSAAGRLEPAGVLARMAGLLIGAELAAARPWWLGQPVTVIGQGWLADCYLRALAGQGVAPDQGDPARAVLDGLCAAYPAS